MSWSRFLRKIFAPLARRPPSSIDLERSIPHLAFEQAALRASAAAFSASGDRFAFEALLIHVRVLRSFYFDKWDATSQWAESTVVAELYFRHRADWRGVKGSKVTPALVRTKIAIDKQLAHLTKERVQTFQELESEVEPLVAELDTVWEHFLFQLGKQRDVQPFRDALSAKCAELGVS